MNYSEIAVEADYRVKTIMRHQQMLNSVRDYLRISFHEEHSMEQLCTRFATNEYILKLGFQMLFGFTVFTYLQRLRLAHAHKELKESQKSIKDIAHEAGYKHVHHFSSAFKKRYGITPVRLRSEEISNEY